MPFQPWGPDHLAALVAIGGGCLLAWKLGHSDRVRWALLAFMLAALALLYWFRLRDGFQAAYDLPLWLCDWVFFLCVAGLVRPDSRLVELTYYWAMAGTLQALVTPDLLVAAPSWDYFLFFLGHGGIVMTVVFLLSSSKVLPSLAGAVRAWGGLLLYTLVVGLLDWAFGWNYGYLRAKPPVPSLLDALGPWPFYVIGGELVALLFFALLWLPWRVAGGRNGIQ